MKVSTIYSRAGVQIITQPFLVGAPLEKLAQKASEDFVRSLGPEAFPEGSTPVSLEILNGGHYYFCAAACEAVRGKPCAVAALRAKRGHDSGETYGGDAWHARDVPEGTTLWKSQGSDWCVRIWENQPIPPGPLLVGDTVATGTTLAGVLEFVVDQMVKTSSVHDIHVFTIAGASSWDGDKADGGIATKLQHVDQTLTEHGRQLTVTFANAQFALQANGTDLSFDGAEMLPEASAEVQAKCGAFASQMRCAVWDWGDRFREIDHHLAEIKEYFSSMDDTPGWLMEGIEQAQVEQKSAAAALHEAEPEAGAA